MKSENRHARHKGLQMHLEGKFKSNQISYVEYVQNSKLLCIASLAKVRGNSKRGGSLKLVNIEG